jgi:high-affinity nickel-transport protein
MIHTLGKAFSDHSSSGRAEVIVIYAVLIAANVAAWIWAVAAFGDNPAALGTAFLAYVLGLRHAVDPDHIAAIDNVVRKLMQEGKRPFAAGFFFSLGHSTIIALAAALIAGATAALKLQIGAFQAIGSIISTVVSAFFLLLLALLNMIILKHVWASFKKARDGKWSEQDEINPLLSGGGLLARIFRPLFRLVSASWQMYPLGFLFGLGFDTATEISLFAVAASNAAAGASLHTIMVFPALFAAGMMLIDTTDSVMMVGAYGWAFLNPVRKLWYNLTITSISVMIAFGIGGVEAIGLLADQMGLKGPIWDFVRKLNENLSYFGYIVIGAFVLAWFVSMIIFKWKGYDRIAYNEPPAATANRALDNDRTIRE